VSLAEVTDLRAVDRAVVYKAGQLAGTLVRERDDVVFTYDDAYLAEAPAGRRVQPAEVRGSGPQRCRSRPAVLRRVVARGVAARGHDRGGADLRR
jgi:hypothetical protein